MLTLIGMQIFIAIILMNNLQQLVIYVMQLPKNKLTITDMTLLQNNCFDK